MRKLTLSEFRERFPEFTETLYPDLVVNIRLELANEIFKDPPWSNENLRLHVTGLHVAHFLKMNGSASAGGIGVDGNALGVVNSKSVDGASVSFDVTQGTMSDAGQFNTTSYGRDLWYWMGIVGAGAILL